MKTVIITREEANESCAKGITPAAHLASRFKSDYGLEFTKEQLRDEKLFSFYEAPDKSAYKITYIGEEAAAKLKYDNRVVIIELPKAGIHFDVEMKRVQREIIDFYLGLAKQNSKHAASLMNMSRTTLVMKRRVMGFRMGPAYGTNKKLRSQCDGPDCLHVFPDGSTERMCVCKPEVE